MLGIASLNRLNALSHRNRERCNPRSRIRVQTEPRSRYMICNIVSYVMYNRFIETEKASLISFF